MKNKTVLLGDRNNTPKAWDPSRKKPKRNSVQMRRSRNNNLGERPDKVDSTHQRSWDLDG